jgi:hypothetical protein
MGIKKIRKEIIDDHPLLFRHVTHLEINNGWLPLVYELSSKIETIIKQMDVDHQKLYFAEQVKEKYATLRFYMSTSNKEIDEIIAHYTKVAQKTCECCGSIGKLDKRANWLSIRCEDCK